MSWLVLLLLAAGLGLAFLAALARRQELARMRGRVAARDEAVRHGADKARLQHPVIDLSRCLGCGTCVSSCPEDGVLELVHGQALVVRGARCQGIAACARECPVGAISVTLSDLAERTDVPALDEELEAVGAPGLFLAGEVTAHALVKTAVEQGTAVAGEVARRSLERLPSLVGERGARARRAAVGVGGGGGAALAAEPFRGEHDAEAVAGEPFAAGSGEPGPIELCVVGAGPAGLACSLEATRLGVPHVLLDQEAEPGGTVAKYPRRKLVVTQPIHLPLHGRLERTSYAKEELVDLWHALARDHALPFRGGVVFQGVEREPDGVLRVVTDRGVVRARHVCLALGRRGVPRRLGVPGEELAKVAYALLDARSFQGRRVLVVGGGDSAVEAALALAEQPGNAVTLSYRRAAFVRIRSRNDERLRQAVAAGRLALLLESEVVAIEPARVRLRARAGDGGEREVALENDEVFVMAGGTPPTELLERSGVSFDPALRPPVEAPSEQGTGLLRALGAGFALTLLALAWLAWHRDYYLLPLAERPADAKHGLLRPAQGIGLWAGSLAVAMIALNLLYLARRAPGSRLRLGSLRAWMSGHVATGVLAFLLACVHAAMAPRNTVGGHGFWALAVLLATGAIGRYFYAWVPRAANGRELDLAEVKARLGRLAEEWDQGQQRFRERVRDEVGALIDAAQWRGSFLGRVVGLVAGERRLRRALGRLAAGGRAGGIDEEQVRETLAIARRAHRTALMAAHYEDLRAVLGAWRWLHRWMAALLVLLVGLHVAFALFYGGFFAGGAR